MYSIVPAQVYWSTRKKDDGDIKAAAAAVPAATLKRQSSGVTTLSLLKGDKKNMDPAELIKVRCVDGLYHFEHNSM